jgi:hypothetical protein
VNKRGSIEILVVGLILIVLSLGGYWYWQTQKSDTKSSSSQIPTATSIPANISATPTPSSEIKEVEAILNQYVYGADLYPAIKLKLMTPLSSHMDQSEDKQQVTIKDDDFTFALSLISEAINSPFDQELNSVPFKNPNFEGDLFRVESDGKYQYTNSYETTDRGGCNQHKPRPVACGALILGMFNVSCQTKTNSGLGKCDAIAESISYEKVTEKYVLNNISLKGEKYPYLEFEILRDPTYTVETGGQVDNELTVKNNLFTLKFWTSPEGSYQAQYEELPDYSQISNSALSNNLFRVKSNIPQYPDYHYSTSFERKDQGGCKAYSGDSIVACDGGNIAVYNQDKRRIFMIGCDVTNKEDVNYCDQIISTLKVTAL